jgi:hypothetical protein
VVGKKSASVTAERFLAAANVLILCAVPILIGVAALVLTADRVHASTVGNTDRFEATDMVGSPIYGAPTPQVSQRYGCTTSGYETLIDALTPTLSQGIGRRPRKRSPGD